jgi:protein dithiol:quinone oxidoreductase
MISIRMSFLAIALACAGLMCTALYMQEVMGLNPCYLCIVQRVFVVSTGVIALLAFFHNPGQLGIRVYSVTTAISAFAGSGFSIRQLWLQSLPADQVPACGPPADYLMDSFLISEWLPMLLKGDGNCAEVQWTFLGLSIPGWLLPLFIAIGLFALWQSFRRP